MGHFNKIRVRLAVGLLAVAWAVRALSGVETDSLLPALVFYAAALIVVCAGALALLQRAGRWMRPHDEAWVQRQARAWSWPGLAAALVAVLLSLDLGAAVWLREPAPHEVAVVRSECTRISSSKVKSTVQSAAADGQWCFQPTARSGWGGGRLWRVDIDRVRPARAVGQPGRLQLSAHPSWIFGAGAYTVVQGVR